MSKEDKKEEGRWYDYLNELKDVISDFGGFIIAIIVIAAFIHITLVAVYAEDFSFENFKEIAAIYGVWLGTVIGYFFGSRQVEVLSKRVSELLYDLDFQTASDDEKAKETEHKLNEYEDLYNSYKNELQIIAIKYRDSIEEQDLQRLNNEFSIRV